jgi:hypothetical protein
MKFFAKRHYPKELTIKGNVWCIKWKRSLDYDPEDIPNDVVGLCDIYDRTIYIKLGMSQRDTFDVFIHEILHAFEEEFGFNISGKPHVEGDRLYQLTEAIVDFYENL